MVSPIYRFEAGKCALGGEDAPLYVLDLVRDEEPRLRPVPVGQLGICLACWRPVARAIDSFIGAAEFVAAAHAEGRPATMPTAQDVRPFVDAVRDIGVERLKAPARGRRRPRGFPMP
jgi:hypothetical protein